MGNIKIGSDTSTIHVGSQEVSKIYQGSTEIYTASTASLTIALINDGSTGYSVNVTFSLTTLPTGTTQLRYTISGTGATSSVVTISNLNSSSNVSGTGDFRCRYVIASNQGSFYHVPGDDVTNISLTVEALNSSSSVLATSNTLTGIVIDEDG